MYIKDLPVMIEDKNQKRQAESGLFSSRAQERQIIQPYECASAIVHTMLQNLNRDYQSTFEKTPIHHIENRIKTPESIERKLIKNGLTLQLSNLKNIYDIAGLRVICYYVDDIYKIADFLISQEDIFFLRESDYIKNPKPNGYRSLHLVLKVRVCTLTGYKYVPVEVQLRTLAMDFWASIEHQMVYKSEVNVSPEIREKIRICSETINEVDNMMREISVMLDGDRWEKIVDINEFR